MKNPSALLILFFFFLTLIACGNSSSSENNQTSPSTNSEIKTLATNEPTEKPMLTSNENVPKTKLEASEAKSVSKAKEIAVKKKAEFSKVKKMAKKAKERATKVKEKPSKPIVKTTKAKEVAPTETPKTSTPEKVVVPDPPVINTTPKVEKPKVEAAKVKAPKVVEKPVVPTWNHDTWEKLVNKYVSASGKVNYKGFKADKAKLDAYLAELEAQPIDKDWSRKKKMAYWINAYNAYTVKLIVDNYPTSSITKLDGGKPWDKKWIKLDGKSLSLNDIEHKILRPTYKDARIHFAVNCAAKSCPPILNHAWTEKNLNTYLEKQAKSFINDSKVNSISADKVVLSKIFEWYKEDFADGDLISYLNIYSKTKINPGAAISFMEYEWALNE